jgi:hypothetical protein
MGPGGRFCIWSATTYSPEFRSCPSLVLRRCRQLCWGSLGARSSEFKLLAQTSRAPLANRGWPSKSKPKPVLHGRKRYYALRGATGCEVEALWDAAVPNSPISLELSIPTHCEFARDVAPRHCGRSAVPPGRLDRNLPVLCAGTVLPRRAHRGAAFAGAGRPLGNNWSSAHGADPGSPVF